MTIQADTPGDAPLHPGLNLGPNHGEAHHGSEVTVFGFWVFLMSDLVTFGLFFATYATMIGATAGGPGPAEVYDLTSVAGQTALLLLSSLAYGWASLALKYHEGAGRQIFWLAVTFVLGAGFLFLELRDFASMIDAGATPMRSGWLSALYALVGLHGLHITAGLIWILTMMVQISTLGLTPAVKSRLIRLGLYWHFLDIIWIGIFSVVFLGGVA